MFTWSIKEVFSPEAQTQIQIPFESLNLQTLCWKNRIDIDANNI